MQCELIPPPEAAPGLLQALCSVAVGSLAGLVSGVLICAALVQLAGCAAAGVPVAAAAPAPPVAAAAHDDPCDPRARICR
jgi:hypothetical protein